MVIVTNQALWLEAMDELIDFPDMPIYLRWLILIGIIGQLVPKSIKPNPSYLAVICEQFGELCLHEMNIAHPITFLGTTSTMARTPGLILVIGSIPVEQRIINE